MNVGLSAMGNIEAPAAQKDRKASQAAAEGALDEEIFSRLLSLQQDKKQRVSGVVCAATPSDTESKWAQLASQYLFVCIND